MAIYRDDPGFALLDRRAQTYRYDLEKDIRWDLVDAPGTYAPTALMRSIGVDVEGLRAAGAWDEFEWLWALLVCHQFVELERELLVFLKEDPAFPPTESLGWLKDEEVKHIKTFNRLRQHLLARRPEQATRVKALLNQLHPPMDLVASVEKVKDEVELRYVKWLPILVFEEYTVYLHRALVGSDELVQPTWLDVHRCHAQEEVRHVETDVQYVNALAMTPEARHQTSQRSIAYVMGRYAQTFRTPVKMLLELRPELRGRFSEGRPPAGFTEALFRAPEFAASRTAAPYLAWLAGRRTA